QRHHEVLDRPEAGHRDAERQPDRDRKRSADQHALHRVEGMQRHGAVGERCVERAGDHRQRRHQGRRKESGARDRLVDRGEHNEGQGPAYQAARELGRDRHVIMPHRTTVYASSRWKTNFSSASPTTAITTMPASITSVARNSRAPKISQPSPHGTAASISTPTRMRHACARPRRKPVRIKGSAPGRITLTNSRRWSAPIDSAERSQISLTALTPVQVLKMTGKADTKPTSSTAVTLPRPNHRRNSGAYAMPGIGAMALTGASRMSSAKRERPMRRPITTP